MKFSNWQYWPSVFFYVVPFFYYLILSFKARSLFFFHGVNPGIFNAGLIGDAKWGLLQQLPKYAYPRTLLFDPYDEKISLYRLKLPLIIKPNEGQRGKGVCFVNSFEEMDTILSKVTETQLVQEYSDLNEEWGVFFIKFPGQQIGKVFSLMKREFWGVEGDGVCNILQLAQESEQWILQAGRLKAKRKVWEQYIPAKGEVIKLEPIGNHNRGTTFLDKRTEISSKLSMRVNQLLENLNGFHFGRLDMKVHSMEDFIQGGPVAVLEINGMKAEPAHIYQPGYPLLQAWCDVMWYWKIAFVIAMENQSRGYVFPNFSKGIRLLFDLEKHHLALN